MEESKAATAITISEKAAALDQVQQEKFQLETELIEKDTELGAANQEIHELEQEVMEMNTQLEVAFNGNAELDQALVDQRRLVEQWEQFHKSIKPVLEAHEQATRMNEGLVEEEDLKHVVEDATTKEALEEESQDGVPTIHVPATSGTYTPIVNSNLVVEPEPPAEPRDADVHQRSAKNVFPKPQKNLLRKEIARRKADKE